MVTALKLNSKSFTRVMFLGSALVFAGAEFRGCTHRMSVSERPEAYAVGVEMASVRASALRGGCGSLYPLPAGIIELGDQSMDDVAIEAATNQANCRLGYQSASWGHGLRAEGQDVGLCATTVGESIQGAVPWLDLSAAQHLQNVSTCERAFYGSL